MIESFPTFKQLFVRNQEIFVESSSPLSGAGFIIDVILCFLFFFSNVHLFVFGYLIVCQEQRNERDWTFH